jgi:hypothetical protein
MSTEQSKKENMRYKGNSIVLGPHEGDILGQPGILHDRFMISGNISGGGFALIEHFSLLKRLQHPCININMKMNIVMY